MPAIFEKLFKKKQTIVISYASSAGRVRDANEDNFYVDGIGTRTEREVGGYKEAEISERCIIAVCDGMGGEKFGAEASETAVKTLEEFADRLNGAEPDKLADVVDEYVGEANNRIVRMTKERNADVSGSTLVLLCTVGTCAYTFSVGDSRIYYYNKSEGLRQVSQDQTLAAKKLKAGIYTENEAKLSADAHKLTSFLGADKNSIGLKALRYEPFDISEGTVLLCSDGLTDMVEEPEIAEFLRKNGKDTASLLKDEALENGGLDNITCITFSIK